MTRSTQPTWADVTPKSLWLDRRAFMGAGAAALLASPSAALALTGKPSPYSIADTPTKLSDITSYNNFYEFGFDKSDPSRNSGAFKPAPWAVSIDGMVDRPGSYGLDDIAPPSELEERIYRLRCVEAWSMIIPWIGVPLSKVLDKVGVQPGAKFVRFESVVRPEEMPGQARKLLDFPYVEGLRIDEAMNPLALLATGLYSEPLPVQNGAPIRLVVPWKYGFKSAKSIVRITLTDRQPVSTWQQLQPSEYGFYANVNPAVNHPRWSQASERRIGAGLFAGRQPTLPFNGYGDQVASLYAGMDLAKNY